MGCYTKGRVSYLIYQTPFVLRGSRVNENIIAVVLNIVAISFGGLLLSVCLDKTPIDRFLRVRWLRIIAVLSYSIYLIHLMLAPLAGALSSALLPAGSHAPSVEFLAYLPVFVGLSVAVATVLHFIVEKPFLLLLMF